MSIAIVDIAQVDACLPQTQCTLCGYPRCLDYAEAVSAGLANINRCAPGSEATIAMLAELLQSDPLPLDAECDQHPGRQAAVIREHDCIGCTLCMPPCPVDAIIGAAKHMHTVAAQLCTGCRLCVPACPVDCIEMIEHQPDDKGAIWDEFTNEESSRWRILASRHFERTQKKAKTRSAADSDPEELRRQIREAVNRTRTKRWRKERKNAATRSSHPITR